MADENMQTQTSELAPKIVENVQGFVSKLTRLLNNAAMPGESVLNIVHDYKELSSSISSHGCREGDSCYGSREAHTLFASKSFSVSYVHYYRHYERQQNDYDYMEEITLKQQVPDPVSGTKFKVVANRKTGLSYSSNRHQPTEWAVSISVDSE